MDEKKDELNVTRTLFELSTKVERIDSKLDLLIKADDKADKALAKSIENEHAIETMSKWTYGIGIALIVSILGIIAFFIERGI
ncbi:hypothetical protein [Liquorilactobacillus mali]|nr:hypothetical protein [Liquorilactobacillus mali]EJF01096.1 hypothetical protein LMA_01869 [Liquorilactobacillus mali KCTC 3596 = DSM 20444]MDN7144453.1 hypothetical protein [Liquorilactobacillus mali]QFQ74971.1 hypothetical protein LM596_07485 [Liquorilactobacillus mali]